MVNLEKIGLVIFVGKIMKQRKNGLIEVKKTIVMPSGKKIRKSFYGRTEREVKRKINECRAEVTAGKTFAAVAKEWFDQHEQKVEYYTIKSYKAPYNHAIEEFGTNRITEIFPDDIQKFINQTAATGYAHQTVKMRLIICSLIFKYAVIKGYVNSNPAAYATLPRNLKRTRRDDVPQDVIDKIKASSELYPYFLLMTGMRPSEALAIRYEDIDRAAKRIRVYKKVVYHGQQPEIVTKTKTEKSRREIILLDKLADRLPKGKKGFVFENGGIPYKPKFLLKYWKGLDLGITAYQLRHAYITMLYEAGIEPEVAMTQTGHSSISTMRDIYTHIRDNKIADAAKTLNSFIE